MSWFRFPAESSFHASPVSEEALCSVDQLFSSTGKEYQGGGYRSSC